jgi:O-antigen/teichoic acid export membrane protein
MLIAPFVLIAGVLQYALEARSAFATSNLSRSLPQLVTLAVLGILFSLRKITPFSSAYAYMLPPLAAPLVLGWRLRRDIFIKLTHFRDASKDLLSYGIRLYAIDIIGTLSLQVDQVLVVGQLSAEGLGIYVVALNISRVLGVFHTSLVTVLFPKAASLETAEAEALIGRVTRITTFAASLAAVAFIPIIPLLVGRIYGAAFLRVAPVAQILCIEMVVTGATFILAQAFAATGRPGTNAILEVVGLGLTVPFMLLLIPHFGLLGAAGALLLSSSCRLGMTVASYPLILKWKVPGLLITSGDFRFLRERLRLAG